MLYWAGWSVAILGRLECCCNGQVGVVLYWARLEWCYIGQVGAVLNKAGWSGAILGRLEWCYIGQVGEGRAGKGECGAILGRAAAVGCNIVPGAGAICRAGVVAHWVRARRSELYKDCLLYTSPSPRDLGQSRMPSSA